MSRGIQHNARDLHVRRHVPDVAAAEAVVRAVVATAAALAAAARLRVVVIAPPPPPPPVLLLIPRPRQLALPLPLPRAIRGVHRIICSASPPAPRLLREQTIQLPRAGHVRARRVPVLIVVGCPAAAAAAAPAISPVVAPAAVIVTLVITVATAATTP